MNEKQQTRDASRDRCAHICDRLVLSCNEARSWTVCFDWSEMRSICLFELTLSLCRDFVDVETDEL